MFEKVAGLIDAADKNCLKLERTRDRKDFYSKYIRWRDSSTKLEVTMTLSEGQQNTFITDMLIGKPDLGEK